jgi:hypothetical protein
MTSAMLKILIIPTVILVALVIGGSLLLRYWSSDRFDKVFNRQMFKRGLLEIHTMHLAKALSFDTRCVRVESRVPSSMMFQHVFESCGDLWEDFSSNDLHFLGEQKAYLTYGWYFAVTVNSGKSWSVWDGWNGELCEQKKMLCFPDSKTVRIRQDGTGSMEIYAGNLPGMPESSGTFLLTTRDFGQTWRLVSESK